MSAGRPDSERNVIPRWRDPVATARQGELKPLRSEPSRWEFDSRFLADQERAWAEHGSLGFALDLVGAALVVGVTPSAREAAEFVLTRRGEVSPVAVSIASRVLDAKPDDDDLGSDESLSVRDQRERIHALRERLRHDPRNTLAWTEMARRYTIAGQRDQARRAMDIALVLAPDHRYVLRSAARLAVHHGEFQRAHSLVANSPATPTDPWLIAAELATAGPAGRPPRHTKLGERLLASGRFAAGATTELASALGTLELRAGSDRTAKRFFVESLSAPTENSVAQGEWAASRLYGLELSADQLDGSSEARAHRYGRSGHWRAALREAWAWHFDQPFASGPGEFGSYQASLGEDYEQGAAIAAETLQANPGEFLLTNNLVFCLINLGNLEEAAKRLREIKPESLDRHDRATHMATAGLLAFRSGDPEKGRDMYLQAIGMGTERSHRLVATILLAREELRSRLPTADDTVQEVLALRDKEAGGADISLWLKHLPTVALPAGSDSETPSQD